MTQPNQTTDAIAYINAAKTLSEADISPRLRKPLEDLLKAQVRQYIAEQRARLKG
ncbi:hypothetical protein [Oscillatoria acuminata]|uniref:Uncharacterized protein n=1 Tax=Oscillatoria acuminata PCC 6304 TaxID=56110 RepID=K9TRL9_9CYAN|nr:hypothetical protein [Oscillatoria acuminata]AFY85492.1 hypothetical protein Oscil6304_6032 [Oscillatoria acuminata PCC 6304]